MGRSLFRESSGTPTRDHFNHTGQGLHLPHRVARELDPSHEEALPVILQHGVPATRLAIRVRFEDEYAVRGHHHMIDIQVFAYEVVEHAGAVRSQVLQELSHNPLAIPPQPQPFNGALEVEVLVEREATCITPGLSPQHGHVTNGRGV